MMRIDTLAVALWLLAGISAARAGQPLATDDAAVVAPKTCQVETWVRWMHDSREYWTQPACNFTGNLELALGAARTRSDDGEVASMVQLQAKTLLVPHADTWSFAAAAGLGRDTGAPHGNSAFQLYYAKALASWHPRAGVEVDLDLGAASVYRSGAFALAAAAIQYQAGEHLQLLAEAFRDEPGRGKYQVGIRCIVIPDRFEAYVSYGNRFNGPSRRWSAIMGIRVQTPAFLS
jgi:hypothetical protein